MAVAVSVVVDVGVKVSVGVELAVEVSVGVKVGVGGISQEIRRVGLINPVPAVEVVAFAEV